MGAFILAGGGIAIILTVFYIGEYTCPIQLFNNMRSNNRINGFTMGVENENHNVNYRKIIDEIMESIPKTVSDDSRDYLKNIIDMIDVSKCSFNVERFFKEYRGFDTILINIICNNNGITKYTPLQIKLSLEKALKQYELLEVSSCLGYQKVGKYIA